MNNNNNGGEAYFKHTHSQKTQFLADKIIEIGPHQYDQLIKQAMQTLEEGSFARHIFAFGVAELYIRVREKMEVIAELEDG